MWRVGGSEGQEVGTCESEAKQPITCVGGSLGTDYLV